MKEIKLKKYLQLVIFLCINVFILFDYVEAEDSWNTATISPDTVWSKTITYNGQSYTMAGKDLPGVYHWGWNVASIDDNGHSISGAPQRNDETSTIGLEYNNVWGGGDDNESNHRGLDLNNPTDRQGPCPDGWHVPSLGEWAAVIIAWCHLSSNNCTQEDLYWKNGGNLYSVRGPQPLFSSDFAFGINNSYWSSSPFELGVNGEGASTLRQPYIDLLGHSDGRGNNNKVRCFKNSKARTNPLTYTLTFDTVGGDEMDDQVVEEDWIRTKPNIPTKSGYIFKDWYTSTNYSQLFNFSQNVTGNKTAYAKWEYCGDGYKIANNKCISNNALVSYGKGYIKVTNGIDTMYIADRNVGAEYSVLDDPEDETLTYGNYYFRGNNNGVKYTNFIFGGDNGDIVTNIEELAASGFDGGVLGQSSGWMYGKNNPCDQSKGEFLPTPEDRKDLLELYGEIYGYDLSDENDENDEEYFYYYDGGAMAIQYLNDILVPNAGYIYEDTYIGDYYYDKFTSLWTSLSNSGYIGELGEEGLYYQSQQDVGDWVNTLAMPVRCFFDSEYIEALIARLEYIIPIDDDFEISVGEETYTEIPDIMTVTTGNISELNDEPVYGEVTVDFGSNESAKFSKLVKVNVPVEGVNRVVVKVKHEGSEEYNFDGLTKNSNASCDANGRPTSSQYNGETITVVNGFATIYTCEASSFIAVGEGPLSAQIVLSVNKGELTIGTETGNLNLGQVNVSNNAQELSGSFGANSFWVEDMKGVESGYYTTISVTDLEGSVAGHTISANNIYLKTEDGIPSYITGASVSESKVIFGEGITSWHNGSGQVNYFQRLNTSTADAGRVGKWGDNLQIKVNIPAHTPYDTYRGTITYTLYDMDS